MASAPVISPAYAADSTKDALTQRHTGRRPECQPYRNWRRSMPTKTREKKTSAGKTNALQTPLQPSEELAAAVGSGPPPPGQEVGKIGEGITSQDLQNPENRRGVPAYDSLR